MILVPVIVSLLALLGLFFLLGPRTLAKKGDAAVEDTSEQRSSLGSAIKEVPSLMQSRQEPVPLTDTQPESLLLKEPKSSTPHRDPSTRSVNQDGINEV